MNLIVSEAIRVFPLFLSDNSTAEPLVNGRKLVVRMTETYADVPTALVREHCLDWDYIAGVIDASHDDG
ncbi:hypothetical protein [Rhodopirellula halodulae]|uniref:hypothetical protein n=1 Tax=Rhodopirellula halodulae TaxID=2894198 RepID=UPI001E4B8839|nr:hypothetical protein [Rhodopirellula sp. JC737]MCC9658789.1 hypothetical protein [Rhodopirellula sp. JC737]